MKGTRTRISDLALAAYLLARDYPLVDVEGPCGGRRNFIFADVPKDVLVAFYSGQVSVDARKLLGALRDLKGLTVQAL